MTVRSGRMIRCIAIATLVATFAGLAFAQQPASPAPPPETLQLMMKSLQSLPQYTYKQSMEMKMKGEVKSTTLSQVYFDADGKPQTRQLSAPPPTEPSSGGRGRHGRVKEKVVENKKEEMQEFVQQLMKLSSGYLVPTKDKFQTLAQKGAFTQDQTGIQLTVQDYLQPGDKLILIFDPATKRQRRAIATTTLDDGPVTVTADYRDLADGLTYGARTLVSAPKKELEIKLETFEYAKAN